MNEKLTETLNLKQKVLKILEDKGISSEEDLDLGQKEFLAKEIEINEKIEKWNTAYDIAYVIGSMNFIAKLNSRLEILNKKEKLTEEEESEKNRITVTGRRISPWHW